MTFCACRGEGGETGRRGDAEVRATDRRQGRDVSCDCRSSSRPCASASACGSDTPAAPWETVLFLPLLATQLGISLGLCERVLARLNPSLPAAVLAAAALGVAAVYIPFLSHLLGTSAPSWRFRRADHHLLRDAGRTCPGSRRARRSAAPDHTPVPRLSGLVHRPPPQRHHRRRAPLPPPEHLHVRGLRRHQPFRDRSRQDPLATRPDGARRVVVAVWPGVDQHCLAWFEVHPGIAPAPTRGICGGILDRFVIEGNQFSSEGFFSMQKRSLSRSANEDQGAARRDSL